MYYGDPQIQSLLLATLVVSAWAGNAATIQALVGDLRSDQILDTAEHRGLNFDNSNKSVLLLG